MELSNCLEALSASELPSAALECLSGLEGDALKQFARAWRQLDVERRRQVVASLVEMAEDNAELDFASVFKVCMRDSDAKVRATAAEGLWEDVESDTLDLLVSVLRKDADPTVRAAAAAALGHAVELIEFEELGGMLAWQVKYGLLDAHKKDPDLEVRRRALESLSFLSEPPIPDLIQQAYDSLEQRIKVSAVFAMGRNADSRWRDIILKELNSRDPEVRFEAARAAGQLEDEEMVWPLARLITDEDVEVRLQAVTSLGEIGGELAERTLEGLAGGQDPVMREAAADALETLRSWEEPLNFRLDFNPDGREREEDEGLS
ncbi:MAG: HEAT repeat domain-containing protein [Chloroflexi bacterium]|nr:HEAT repeat domain-containing protein [Chloroflexota bacterium]